MPTPAGRWWWSSGARRYRSATWWSSTDFANVTLSETAGTADTVETTLTGFLTPVSGAFRTRVGVVAYEGDVTTTGDQIRLNNVNLTNAVNPSSNIFNSTNTCSGTM
jgi:hypothetical protein